MRCSLLQQNITKSNCLIMKAVTIHPPHQLSVDNYEAPTSVGPGQVEIRVHNGGICGSDLHYYSRGGFGNVIVREPMILGHEISGEVIALGDGVTGVSIGDRVAVNPGNVPSPCCYTREGLINHALDMRFYGSAMRYPHVQGAFRELLVCEASQLVPLPAKLSFEHATFAEPLAVCLHAAKQAGDLLNRRVLISGAGPIGALTTMVVRLAGAREIVVTDLLDAPLAKVSGIGASEVINLKKTPHALERYTENKGHFDVALECSGSSAGLSNALNTVRPRGTIVQIGIGEAKVSLAMLVSKEITLRGSFRYIGEFEEAVATLSRDDFDVSPLLTKVFPVKEALHAFTLASDKGSSMKVLLKF